MRAIKTILLVAAVVGLMGVPGISAAAEEPLHGTDFQSFDETDGGPGGSVDDDDGSDDDGTGGNPGGLPGTGGDPGCGFEQIGVISGVC